MSERDDAVWSFGSGVWKVERAYRMLLRDASLLMPSPALCPPPRWVQLMKDMADEDGLPIERGSYIHSDVEWYIILLKAPDGSGYPIRHKNFWITREEIVAQSLPLAERDWGERLRAARVRRGLPGSWSD